MHGRASLKEIVEGIEFQSDEITAYLHRPTGGIVSISDQALQPAEEGTGGDAGVEESELAAARGILQGGDDYLQLPDRCEIDEYRMMKRFVAGVARPVRRSRHRSRAPAG